MTGKEIREELAEVLLEWVKEKAKTPTTPEEVEALPKVAEVLASMLFNL